MQINPRIFLALALAVIIAAAALPCLAQDRNRPEPNIGTPDGRRGGGERPEFGPPDRPPRGPGRERFTLTDEEINRIVESVKKRDANQAKELTKLREKDPDRFMEELRRHASEEYGQIVRDRIEKWRERRRAEFEEWLGKNFPSEGEELTKLKETNADLYGKKYDLAWKKYSRVFEESKRSPELADVLIEDLKLKRREDELVSKIKTTTNQKEKEKLDADLEEVVGLRYDLIVRRKQKAYERLLKVLEDLKNRMKESSAEIRKALDSKVKAENVQQRKKDLLEEKKVFRWD